jgi:hypothetical protein
VWTAQTVDLSTTNQATVSVTDGQTVEVARF